MSAACGAGTEKQRGTRVRPGAPADGRPTTPSLRDCLWTPATNAWPVTSVWAHGGASTAAVNHTNLAEELKEDFDLVSAMAGRNKRARQIVQTIREQISRHGRSPLGDQTHVQELN